ncbi:MAG: hypothetical protein LBD67_01055 [Candidatus Accumulibacter sp.]|nr:hypothetical protein [Accumulibacter sp.]
MRLIRVFPRRTKATPDDALAVVGRPPDLLDEADEVHISVSFSWDIPAAERLAEQWRHVAPVKIGGPAYGSAGLEFVPGRYLKPGYVITSRGCPRRCWFCGAWKRYPEATPLPTIAEGWNVLDDNLLACPRPHVEAVFAMLRRQKRCVEFTGGLEALSLQDYHVELLASLTPRPVCFFAYDPGDDFGPIENAAMRMRAAGFTTASHRLRCYVLIGFPKDTLSAAEKRLRQILGIGMTPMAMLWRGDKSSCAPDAQWRRFQRQWARPAIIHSRAGEKT